MDAPPGVGTTACKNFPTILLGSAERMDIFALEEFPHAPRMRSIEPKKEPTVRQIHVKIDGVECDVDAGKSILEVAAMRGISIPTLCHHKKISKTTSCFVCLVKDNKTGQFLPSCSSELTNGMDIDASGPEVAGIRRSALDLLLSEHAGDCEAPCTVACPAHARVEEYVRQGKQGQHLEALRIIKERIPLPISISRVCPRF